MWVLLSEYLLKEKAQGEDLGNGPIQFSLSFFIWGGGIGEKTRLGISKVGERTCKANLTLYT